MSFYQSAWSWIFIGLLWPGISQARWINPEEADAVVENKSIHVTVHADGSSVYQTVTRVRILNEIGRNDWGTVRFNYSPKNVRTEVVSAQTQTGPAVFKVNRRDIVDTQIFATENGFDESRQIVVSFPQVQVGSILTIEVKQVQFHPYLEGQFFDRFGFGEYEAQQHGEIEISSQRPLYFQVNDPQNKVGFKKIEREGHYNYNIQLKTPLVQRVVEETRAIIPDRKLTWLAVTSAQDFAVMFAPLAKRYENILAAPLSEKFKPLMERARSEKDPVAKINLVLASLADMIRYMGDWRSVDGAWVPRSLEQITETRFGDCKDFSTLTVKILRELGMKSFVALTFRGIPAHDVPDIASPNFNHAIVSINLGNRQLWVDPTDFQSFAAGVFEDIADRRALVLEPGKIELRRIDFTPSGENSEDVKIHTRIGPGKQRRDRVELELTGAAALPATGEELRYSKEQIEAGTVSNAANIAEVMDYHFEPFDLKSRIVQPIHFGWVINRLFNPIHTSMGPALDFSPPDELKELLRIDRTKRESDVKLAVPFVTTTTVLLENVGIRGDFLRDCQVRSPWIDYAFVLTRHPAKIVRRMEIKKYSIPAEDVKSDQFSRLQTQLQACGQPRYLVFQHH